MTTVIQEAIVYLLFLWTNIAQWIIYLNATMKRRRPLKALIIYCFTKSLLVNVLFKTLVDNLFVNNEIINGIYSGVVILSAILTYVVLLYTFNESFTKIAIMSTCVDIFASMIGYLSGFIVNLMVGKVSFNVEAPLYPTDFLLPIIAGVFTYFVMKPIKMFAPRLKAWDIKRKKFTMTIFIAYMGCSFYSMHESVSSVANLISIFSAILFSYILVIYVNYYHRTMLWENEMLKKQQVIAKMQYEGIVFQSEQIEHLQYEIDTQMQTVLQLSENAENKSEQIQKYISSLKQKADDISLGIFCDDRELDSVLYLAAQKCKAKGVEADFYLQGYKPNTEISEKLSNDIQKMLDNSINKAKKKLSLSIATIKGKVVIKTETDGKEKVTMWN